jgi:PAN domain
MSGEEGVVNEVNTISACQEACVSQAGCHSVDFTNDNGDGFKCALILKPRIAVTKQGTMHYVLKRAPTLCGVYISIM